MKMMFLTSSYGVFEMMEDIYEENVVWLNQTTAIFPLIKQEKTKYCYAVFAQRSNFGMFMSCRGFYLKKQLEIGSKVSNSAQKNNKTFIQ